MAAFLIQPTSLSLLPSYHWRRLSSRLHRMRLALHARGWKGLVARIGANGDHISPPADGRGELEAAQPASGGKRILVIDVTTPRPDRDSGSVRAVGLMRAMRASGHSVDFLPDDRRPAGAYAELLRSDGIRVHAGEALVGYPAWFARHRTGYDVVVVCRYHLGEFLIPLLRKLLPGALVVLDTVDLHHLREQREARLRNDKTLARLAGRTRRRELETIASADASWVVSPVERELLQTLVPEARVLVMPNIVEAREDLADFDQREGLLFLGGAMHPPNVDAVKWLLTDIFPRVRDRLPDCTLHIVGAGLAEAMAGIPLQEGVRLHGFVPDIAPLLSSCRVGLAPLRFGAGVKGKVNAYMAAGMPTVATPCAAEGMHARDGHDMLIAESANDLANAIARACTDRSLWQRLSARGMDNVRRHFSGEAARKTLDATLAGAR